MEAGPGYRLGTAFVDAAEAVEGAMPAVTEPIKSRLDNSILFSPSLKVRGDAVPEGPARNYRWETERGLQRLSGNGSAL